MNPHHLVVLTVLQKSPQGQTINGHSHPLEDVFYSYLSLGKETFPVEATFLQANQPQTHFKEKNAYLSNNLLFLYSYIATL